MTNGTSSPIDPILENTPPPTTQTVPVEEEATELKLGNGSVNTEKCLETDSPP